MMVQLKGVSAIFDTVQRRPTALDDCVDKFKNIYLEQGADLIWKGGGDKYGVDHVINYLFNVKHLKEDAVSRITNFLAIIANETELAVQENHPLFSAIFDKCISFCEDEDPVKRQRSAAILAALIKKLHHEEYISDPQFDQLQKVTLLLRIDKVPAIRCEGMKLISKLQNPKDPNCGFVNKMLFHMAKDPKAEVRRTCVSCVALCIKSLVKIQQRCMDVSASVRKEVYLVYANRMKMKVLQLTDRAHILKRGFADRSPAVVTIVREQLIPRWLSQCGDSLLTLLENLDVYYNMDTTLAVIDCVLEGAKDKELLEEVVNQFVASHVPSGNMMKEDKLSVHSLMLWRGLCLFLKKHSEDDLCHALLFKVLPETGRLADLLVQTLGRPDSEFDALHIVTHRVVCQQLLLLLCQVDFSEFAGLTRLTDAVKTFLSKAEMEHFYSNLITLLATIHGHKADALFPEVIEVISEIESPLLNEDDARELLSRSICLSEPSGQCAPNEEAIGHRSVEEPIEIIQARVELTVLRERMEAQVENQEFMQAQITKELITKMQVIIDDYEKQKVKETDDFLMRENEEDDEEEMVPEDHQPRNGGAFTKEMELDPATLRRCLAIMAYTIKATPPRKLDSVLETFIESRALKGICMTEQRVRSEATRCLVLACIISKQFAQKKMFILTQIAKSDIPEIRTIALRGIFDLLLRFGIKSFSGDEEDISMISSVTSVSHSNPSGNTGDDGMQKIVVFLVDFLKLSDEQILEVVVEGLCKLMFLGYLVSPRILAHLITFWFNGNYSSNSNIIHCLGMFFEAYSRVSRERMMVVKEAFFPAIRLFLDASELSALSHVSVDRVVDTLVSLCDIRCIPPKDGGVDEQPTPHDLLAELLLNRILADPYTSEVKYYTRALSQLFISASADHRQLYRLSKKVFSKISSAQSKRQVTRFHSNLAPFLENVQPGQPEEESDGSDEDHEAGPAHDIVLRKRLQRTSQQLDAVFSDSE